MKLLFIAPQPFFRERGTPIRALHQIEELSRMGHRADIVCYPFGEEINVPGVRVFRTIRLPGIRDIPIGPSLAKFPMDFVLFWKAFWLCLRNRYDVIQAVEESAFFAVWLKKLFRCRLIYNMDSFISDQLQFSGFVSARPIIRFAQACERSAMRNAAYVVTVGPVLSDVVRRFAPGTKVLQLEDAPLEASFREAPDGARRVRDELNLGAAPVCVYTGNFERYQGVDLLVRAAGLVARERPDVRFVFVGGTEPQVEEMRRLAAQADPRDGLLHDPRGCAGDPAQPGHEPADEDLRLHAERPPHRVHQRPDPHADPRRPVRVPDRPDSRGPGKRHPGHPGRPGEGAGHRPRRPR
jgi:glycosyltransferase involved in cell wall biosynthesis